MARTGDPVTDRSPDILCAGEAVIDMIPDGDVFRPVPGGAALNSARAAARLGASVGFLGALSRDALGRGLAEAARAEGVDLRFCLRSDAPTPISIAELQDGNARYAIHHAGTAGEAITSSTIPRPDAARVLLLGGFSLIQPLAGDAFESLASQRPPACLLYLDLNIRPGMITDAAGYRARLHRLIACSDIIKASEEDLDWLGDDPLAAAPRALFLHTLGAGGASAQKGSVKVHVAAPRGAVIDTVGAGDVFNAAWLAFGLQSGEFAPQSETELRNALTFAVTAASLSTRQRGAIGPTLQEIPCAP